MMTSIAKKEIFSSKKKKLGKIWLQFNWILFFNFFLLDFT